MGSLRHHLAQTIWISRATFASTQPQPQSKGHENEMKWQEMYRCGVLLPRVRVVIDLPSVRQSAGQVQSVGAEWAFNLAAEDEEQEGEGGG